MEELQIKIGKFSATTFTGATNLASVETHRAAIESDDIIYYGVPDSNTWKFYKYDQDAETETLLGTISSSLGTPTTQNCVVRVYSGIVYILCTWLDLAIAAGNNDVEFEWAQYTIATTTYAAGNNYTYISNDVTGVREAWATDIVKPSAAIIFVGNYAINPVSLVRYYWAASVTAVTANATIGSTTRSALVPWGWSDGTDAWIFSYLFSGSPMFRSLKITNAGAVSLVATYDLSIVLLSNDPDSSNSFYHKNGDNELLVFNKELHHYSVLSAAWYLHSRSDDQKNCPVWIETDGVYSFKHLLWDSTGILVEEGGGLMVPFTYTGTDYIVGCQDWFLMDSTIYQLDNATHLTASKAVVSYAYDKHPSGQLVASSALTEKAYLLNDWEETLVGKLAVNKATDKHSRGPTSNNMNNLMAKDLRRRVDIVEVLATAPHTYLTTYVFPLCEFIHEGTLDATQAARDWPAIRGESLDYVLRMVDIPYGYVHHFQPDYSMDWDDGNTLLPMDYKRKYIGKNITGVVDWGTSVSPDLTDWNVSLNGAGATLTVSESLDNKKNILTLTRTAGGAAGRVSLALTADANPTYELSVSTSDITQASQYFILEDGVSFGAAKICCAIELISSVLRISHGNGVGGHTTTTIVSATNNILYNLQIVIDCATDTVDVYHDGILRVDGATFYDDNNFASVETLAMYSAFGADYSMSLDTWGISTDSYTPRSLLWTDTNATSSMQNLGSHYRVHKLLATAGGAYTEWDFTAITTNGEQQGHFYMPTGAGTNYIAFLDGATWAIFLQLNSDGRLLTSTNNAASTDSGATFASDVWIPYKITWIKNGAVEFWVNGVLIATKSLGAHDIDNQTLYITTNAKFFYIDITYCSWNPRFRGDNERNGAIMGQNKMSAFKSVADKFTIDSVYLRGAYSNGEQSKGEYHGPTPGNYDMIAETEEVATDALAETIYNSHAVSQEAYSGWIGRSGNFQYGHRIWFAREKNDTPELYYIYSNSYDAARRQCWITITKYLLIPKMQGTLPLQNRQLISNVESAVNDPTADGISPRSITFSNQTAPSDPAEDYGVMYIDAAGDLIIKIDVGGVLKTITLVDWSAA